MIKPIFSEAIKVKDGIFYNLPYHIARMNRTTKHFFNKEIEFNLIPELIPSNLRNEFLKCRIVYSDEIRSVDFIPYSFKSIESVAIVHDNDIEYSYKSIDRSRLNYLLKSSGYDEIIIIKNGYITDSSSANLVLEDEFGLYTPTTFLLPGTKRELLLNNKTISERTIKLCDLGNYSKIYLINAMIDLEDNITLPIGK